MSDAVSRAAACRLWDAPPRDRVQYADACARAWALLRDALLAAGARAPVETPDAQEAAEASFVVQSALRVLLLDRVQAAAAGAVQPAALAAAAGDGPLERAEAEDVCEFAPAPRAAALRALLAEGESFSARRAAGPAVAAAAFALLFTDDAADTGVPRELLSCAERLDRAETHRALLLAELEPRARDGALSPHHCPRRVARVEAWARAAAAGAFSDDALAAFVEALAATRVNPAAPWPAANERPTAALGRARAERAVAETAAIAPGVRLLLRDDANASDKETVLVALFDHAMRQLHSVEWARLFTYSHIALRGEPERLRRYVDDRMVSPPPALARAPGAWYVAERAPRPGALAAVWRHASAAAAVAHWCAWVADERGGSVSLGRDCRRLLADVDAAGDGAAPGRSLQLKLLEVMRARRGTSGGGEDANAPARDAARQPLDDLARSDSDDADEAPPRPRGGEGRNYVDNS